jgi:uncharacterized protein
LNIAQHILLGLVKGYQWTFSPVKNALLGPAARCRFTPSCSTYAAEAIRVHGAARGSGLALWRLLRCHPWGGCGPDPVPPRRSRRADLVPKIDRAIRTKPDTNENECLGSGAC